MEIGKSILIKLCGASRIDCNKIMWRLAPLEPNQFYQNYVAHLTFKLNIMKINEKQIIKTKQNQMESNEN